MIVELLSELVGYLLLLAFALFFVHYGWFEKYVLLGVWICSLVSGVVFGAIPFLPRLVLGSVKALTTFFLSIVLAGIYLITFVVPFIGGKIQPSKDRIKESLVTSYLIMKAQEIRELMIEIVAEHDDRAPRFETPQQYQEQLLEVKEGVKKRLETGETTLSLSLGAVLIGAKISGEPLFELDLYGMSINLVMEFWLLAIAISIIYRVSVLEFLAYSDDADFDSLSEWDVALSYQKGIALQEFIQGLTVVLVFVYATSNVKFETVKYVLERKYSEDLPATAWLPLARQRLKS